MLSKSYTIVHPSGFHVRPVKLFVHAATQFNCKVTIVKGTKRINGKSSLGLLSLGLAKGDEVTLEVDGEGEEEALKELGAMLEKIYEE